MNYLKIYVLSVLFPAIYCEFIDVAIWEGKSEECGRAKYNNDPLETKSADTARLGQFPWMVRIGSIESDDKITFFCGGTLISSKYVITEVHCGKLGHVVRLGEYILENNKDCDECGVCAPPYQDIKVKKQLFGDDCSRTSRQKIMVMELEHRAQLHDFVRPICIPTQKTCDQATKEGRLVSAGWGQVNPMFLGMNQTDPFKEMKYTTTRAYWEDCDVFGFNHEEDEFCTDGVWGLRGPHCVGDSGGPIMGYQKDKGVNRAYVVGVARYTPVSCEMEKVPLEYLSLCKLSDWIINIILTSIERENRRADRRP